ncbi:MAG: NADPH-dependent F420 reductase [Acidimicrobiales bacterium]
MRIAILGTGRVGTALGTGWSNAGHDVVFGSRNPDSDSASLSHAEAAGQADVVVLAVPYDAAVDTVAAAGDLDGRVVVDATNPVGRPIPPPHRSGAEQVAAASPGARVVKAFNTMGFETMADPVVGGQPALALLAGDDPRAKATVTALARDLGVDPVDAGDLGAARMLENLAELWVHLAMRAGQGRAIAFPLLRR